MAITISDTGNTIRIVEGAVVNDLIKVNIVNVEIDPDDANKVIVTVKNQNGTIGRKILAADVASPNITNPEALRKQLIAMLSINEEPKAFDMVSDVLTYVGYAESGSSKADPVWCVKRINITDGEIRYAGGTKHRDQIWDDRATLTYVL